jgi:hypothetical protein
MSIKNGHRAKAQLKQKKKVQQRMRTQELRASLAAQAVTAPATKSAQADSKTEHAQ